MAIYFVDNSSQGNACDSPLPQDLKAATDVSRNWPQSQKFSSASGDADCFNSTISKPFSSHFQMKSSRRFGRTPFKLRSLSSPFSCVQGRTSSFGPNPRPITTQLSGMFQPFHLLLWFSCPKSVIKSTMKWPEPIFSTK